MTGLLIIMKDIAVSELQFAFSVYIMIDARLLAD